MLDAILSVSYNYICDQRELFKIIELIELLLFIYIYNTKLYKQLFIWMSNNVNIIIISF